MDKSLPPQASEFAASLGKVAYTLDKAKGFGANVY